ncbi:MAG: hypothetical protein KGI72_05370 [Patescibacteria group bacterium]|nr:hypothetical protein [Patescibacteria group bacterium]MDE2233090.1 hypothetical protein [Patescibacteria group bacterium]
MDEQKNIKELTKIDTVLPEDFDGTFRFTNWSNEDFKTAWDNKEYTFPARTTVPMIIPNQTPIEIQNIRKKFARRLGEREFGKNLEYTRLIAQERNPDGTPRANSIHQAGSYGLDRLASYIQRCLEPLEASKASVTNVPKEKLENILSRDEVTGRLNTKPLGPNGSRSLIEEVKEGKEF